MGNEYSRDEIVTVLEALGADSIREKSKSIRSTCPIHKGDNALSFSVIEDQFGNLMVSCFSHGCVSGASLERAVSKTLEIPMRSAVIWLSELLQRDDLILISHGDLIPAIPHAQEVCMGDEEALHRLQALYPYHDYWAWRGYSERIVEEFGLTYRSIDNRVIIPVYNASNQYIGLMKRVLKDEPNVPRYSWESPNINKGNFLYGLPQALKRSMGGVVFMVEGTLDVIKASDLGYPVVASQTNNLSAAQVTDLITYYDKVIIIPDNHPTGHKLISSAEKVLAPFMDIFIIDWQKLPEFLGHVTKAKDLDELQKPAIQELLEYALTSWRHKCRVPRRKAYQTL